MEQISALVTENKEREKTYKLRLEGDVLKLSFGTPSSNIEIVKDAVSEVDRLVASGELATGRVLKLNGPASIPVAVAITSRVSSLYEVVAVFDPKLNGYIVSISSDPTIEIGSVLKNKFEQPSVYSFGLLDPRPIPAAKEANEKVLANAKNGVLGIEMTLPAYVDKCTLGNIDPQHTDGDTTKAAVDVALHMPLPNKDVLMVTVRPDMDSFGSMALLNLRQKGLVASEEILARVKIISLSDAFARGKWTAKSLPNHIDIWAGVDNKELAAISAAVMDFKLPVNERIRLTEEWLETGKEPMVYREKVNKDRIDLVAMLEQGAIKYKTAFDDKLAVVTSSSIAGTSVGDSLAPIAALTNPAFSFQGSTPIVKHTVCQYEMGYVDLPAVLKDLNEIEPGWGGSPTIIGSPQGVSSKITQEQLTEIVGKHLL